MIAFGREIQDYQFAKKKEFLLTAGGSYCSQSLAGNTRKYHGLLVHQGRVSFSACDEFLNGKRISSASYIGSIQDGGLRYLQSFCLYPPRFLYEVEGAALRKTIDFYGALRLRYEIVGEAELRVVPLITDRGVHETLDNLTISSQAEKNLVRMHHLSITGHGCNFVERPDLYRDLWYEQDFLRGYDHTENLYSPGWFEAKGKDMCITLRADIPHPPEKAKRNARPPHDTLQCLTLAAEDFLAGDTILAGYHWFTESWGRDAFVSLPGLLLERGKFYEAERIFRFFARRMKNGLIPNRVPDTYNSSDATLWFVRGLEEYHQYGGRSVFLAEMKPVLEEIMCTYGDSGVATLQDDLIQVAPQSTWMDTVHTSREGKPVEVNALWVNALEFTSRWGLESPVRPDRARAAFARFWNEDAGCLYDRIDPIDPSLRPNQVIALALGLLDDPDREKNALDVVQKHLLTPYGLRTLASKEEGYHGRYQGDVSYHNGCVWPWLLGPYIDAALRQGKDPSRLYLLIQPLLVHLQDAGLGTISEFFDGDAPYHPGGCIAQAWSVAEILRCYRLLTREMEKGKSRILSS
jgi:hypothetical protein